MGDENVNQVVIQIDDTSAVKAAERANSALTQLETRLKGIAGLLQDKSNKEAEGNHKAASSLEAKVKAFEREAALGKTSAEVLLQKRDLLIKQLGSMQREMDRVNRATEDAMKNAAKNTDMFGQSLKGVLVNLSAAYLSYSALKHIVIENGVETAKYAARVSTLRVALDAIAKANNIPIMETRQQEEKLKAQGITTEESRQNLARMIGAGMDIRKAGGLARMAQDTAVVGGINSSEAFQRLVYAIQTRDSQSLRNLGIFVDFERSEKEYAAKNKILGGAAGMTPQQRILSAQYAVETYAPKLQGIYESAMGDVGKQMSSLDRYFKEAKLAIGNEFRPELEMAVHGLEKFAKAAKEASAWVKPLVIAAGAGAATLGARSIANVAGLGSWNPTITRATMTIGVAYISWNVGRTIREKGIDWMYEGKFEGQTTEQLRRRETTLMRNISDPNGKMVLGGIPQYLAHIQLEAIQQEIARRKPAEDEENLKKKDEQIRAEAERVDIEKKKQEIDFAKGNRRINPEFMASKEISSAQGLMDLAFMKRDIGMFQEATKQLRAGERAMDAARAVRAEYEFYTKPVYFRGGHATGFQKEEGQRELANVQALASHRDTMAAANPLARPEDLIEEKSRNAERRAVEVFNIESKIMDRETARANFVKSTLDNQLRTEQEIANLQKQRYDQETQHNQQLFQLEKQFSDQVASSALGSIDRLSRISEQYDRDINAAERKRDYDLQRNPGDWKKIGQEFETEQRRAANTRDVATAQFNRQQYDRETQERLTAAQREYQLKQKAHDMVVGPGGEMQAIERTYQMRIAAAEREFRIARDRGDIDEAAAKAREAAATAEFDKQSAILDMTKQRTAEIQSGVSNVMDSLMFNRGNATRSVMEGAKSLFVNPIREGAAKKAAEQIEPILWGKDQKSGIMGSLMTSLGLTKPGKGLNDVKVDGDGNMRVVIMGVDSKVRFGQTTSEPSKITFDSISSLGIPKGLGGTGGLGGLMKLGLGGFGGGGMLPGGRLPKIASVTGPLFGFPMLTPAGAPVNYDSFGGRGGLSPFLSAGAPSLVQSIANGGGVEPQTGPASGGVGGVFKAIGSTAQQFLFGGGKGSTAGGKAGFGNFLTGLKGNLGGFTRSVPVGTAQAGPNGEAAQGGISGVDGVAGAAMVGGGMYLAQRGLLGNARGTWSGTMQGAAGGALIGYKFGGPIGAAIGASVGFGIGVGQQIAGVESPRNQAKRMARELYGIKIDNRTADGIAEIAKQKYLGKISVAMRSQEIRDLLQLVADSTGQKSNLYLSRPQSASLMQANGSMWQAATYYNGQAQQFASPFATYGAQGATIPTSSPYSNLGNPTIQLSLNGSSAADLLEGRASNAVMGGSNRISTATRLSDPSSLPY